jgi:hypothetical protein
VAELSVVEVVGLHHSLRKRITPVNSYKQMVLVLQLGQLLVEVEVD